MNEGRKEGVLSPLQIHTLSPLRTGEESVALENLHAPGPAIEPFSIRHDLILSPSPPPLPPVDVGPENIRLKGSNTRSGPCLRENRAE